MRSTSPAAWQGTASLRRALLCRRDGSKLQRRRSGPESSWPSLRRIQGERLGAAPKLLRLRCQRWRSWTRYFCGLARGVISANFDRTHPHARFSRQVWRPAQRAQLEQSLANTRDATAQCARIRALVDDLRDAPGPRAAAWHRVGGRELSEWLAEWRQLAALLHHREGAAGSAAT